MRRIAGYLTKNRSEKDQKIAQSTHENGYIKPRKTFWRNSKQLLNKKTILPDEYKMNVCNQPNNDAQLKYIFTSGEHTGRMQTFIQNNLS